MDNPTQEADKTASILHDAATYIEAHGWHQCDYFNSNSAYGAFPPACALGAIGMAITGNADQVRRSLGLRDEEAIADLACFLFPQQWERGRASTEIVAHWNDANAMDAATVVATLRAAAGRPACDVRQ